MGMFRFQYQTENSGPVANIVGSSPLAHLKRYSYSGHVPFSIPNRNSRPVAIIACSSPLAEVVKSVPPFRTTANGDETQQPRRVLGNTCRNS
ncbi:hypothetical protein CEXT_490281 [Caerostris extrusa]|uniref:Uncharacterized protein n=1 Tax=Caerostris extrusa TaxID=172846 RepID=A0AAV4V4G7_CAEEX|nr:hypothetical protein CEXT_490281 [Caerostris extrusa]